MEIRYTEEAIEHIVYWKESGNKIIQKKISVLLESISKTPTEGLGKPERLKHELSGCWSRRIDKEHRLVYIIFDTFIEVQSLRFHY